MKQIAFFIILAIVPLKAMELEIETANERPSSMELEIETTSERPSYKEDITDLWLMPLTDIDPYVSYLYLKDEETLNSIKEDVLYYLLFAETPDQMRKLLKFLEEEYKVVHFDSSPEQIENYLVGLLNNVNIDEGSKRIDSVLGYHLNESSWPIAYELYKRFNKKLWLGKDKLPVITTLLSELYRGDSGRVEQAFLFLITYTDYTDSIAEILNTKMRNEEDFLTEMARKNNWKTVNYLLSTFGNRMDLYNGFFTDFKNEGYHLSPTAIIYAINARQKDIVTKILKLNEDKFQQSGLNLSQEHLLDRFMNHIFYAIVGMRCLHDVLYSLPSGFDRVLSQPGIDMVQGNVHDYLQQRLNRYKATRQLQK